MFTGKAKQFLIVLAKLLIVGGAFYFIYDRIANDHLDWSRFYGVFDEPRSLWIATLIILLTFLNRFVEILKWQNLAAYLQPIKLAKATEQVLAALTAGIFTPNGIGEYAAKALYYEKKDTRAIIFLNLICNGIQLLIAVVAGLAGLLVFNAIYTVIPTKVLLFICGGIIALVVLVLSIKKITIKGYSLQLLGQKINELPTAIHKKNILLAMLRYLALIHQHYFLLLLFGVNQSYFVLITAIAGIYFLGSSLPTFQFLDFAVRGSVALFFFGILGIDEWIVLFAATLQWLLNIVIPVTIGSYYVFRFKSGRVTPRSV